MTSDDDAAAAESKHFTIPEGQYKGKKLKDIPIKELQEYVSQIKADLKKKNQKHINFSLKNLKEVFFVGKNFYLFLFFYDLFPSEKDFFRW